MSKVIVNVSDRKNDEHILDGKNNQTLMELIDEHKIAEPYGICGGEPQCGTCHVYVNGKWFGKLSKKESAEEDMLDMAYEPKKFSRLSCQITVEDSLDGLVVKMPSKQG